MAGSLTRNTIVMAGMLDQMKEGDKIDFSADKIDGAFTVVRVEPAR